MRMEDHAHSLKLEIRHNADPPVPGMGSAIFFHIRRGPDRSTAGCTTMKQEDLVALIGWLDPQAAPHLVLLPQAEYRELGEQWRLP
jgi:L,D-peptidoglycan transpeptidase YkuD (ErfK/YbiS/YcfS/YnhG family)